MYEDEARKFLSESHLKNSYLIGNLDHSEVTVDKSDGSVRGVLIERKSSISLRGSKKGIDNLIEGLDSGEHHFSSIDAGTFGRLDGLIGVVDDHPTWFLKRPLDEFVDLDLGVSVSELESGDEEVIDEYWGPGSDDSTDYIRGRMNSGPAYGIWRDGELVAWCLTHYITDKVINLGFLHVKEDWRRQGFARALTEKLCSYAEKEGLVPVVDIFKDNDASLSLAESMGFVKVVENHWFDGIVD